MYEVWKRLPHWNEKSFPLWREWTLDQRINDRGMQIDMDLVHAAIEASTAAKASADRRVHEMTSGQVSTTGQRDEMLGFMLREYGVSLPDMQKATLERRLDDQELPDEVREMIALRLSRPRPRCRNSWPWPIARTRTAGFAGACSTWARPEQAGFPVGSFSHRTFPGVR